MSDDTLARIREIEARLADIPTQRERVSLILELQELRQGESSAESIRSPGATTGDRRVGLKQANIIGSESRTVQTTQPIRDSGMISENPRQPSQRRVHEHRQLALRWAKSEYVGRHPWLSPIGLCSVAFSAWLAFSYRRSIVLWLCWIAVVGVFSYVGAHLQLIVKRMLHIPVALSYTDIFCSTLGEIASK